MEVQEPVRTPAPHGEKRERAPAETGARERFAYLTPDQAVTPGSVSLCASRDNR